MRNTVSVHENANLQTISAKSIDFESNSTEIIEYSPHFGPFKSILERVSTIAKEDQQLERKRKRDEVVDLCSDDDEKEDVPTIQAKKKVRDELEEHMLWDFTIMSFMFYGKMSMILC
uniref:Uncharacterized protein n=1 Tax=Lactuca sativa TaxID=4236 RepID=A0A9R1WHT4_LACSA|nr:hypothetical protein LSAT_V11C100030920 [Lactuca sativa]